MPHLFYITLDPRRALGIHRAIGAKIVMLYKADLVDRLRDEGAEVFCLEELATGDVRGINDTHELLTHPLVITFISSFDRPEIVVFKPRKKIEKICRKQGWKLLHPSAEVCGEIEDKLDFYRLAKHAGIPIPNGELLIWGSQTYDVMAEKYGSTLVVQKRRGHAGTSTRIVQEPEEMFYDIPEGTRVKVSEFVSGPTYTLNCCLTEEGRMKIGFLWEQVTGISGLTSFAMGTCGVTIPGELDSEVPLLIRELAELTGKALLDRGYFGFFGIDLMIGPNGPVLIEVNPRLTATISFETQLQLSGGETPLIQYHVSAARASHLYERDHSPLPVQDLEPFRVESQGGAVPSAIGHEGVLLHADFDDHCAYYADFSQLTIHSTTSAVRTINHDIDSGIYEKGEDGEWTRVNESVAFEAVIDGQVLLLTRNKGSLIRDFSDYANMVVRGRVLDRDGVFDDRLLDFFEKVVLGLKIRPREFWVDRFGRCESDVVDVLRRPFADWNKVSETTRNRLRQTQLVQGEMFRLLGKWRSSILVEKADGTRGWVELWKTEDEKRKNAWMEMLFVPDETWKPYMKPVQTIEEFFEEWDGHPYLWGGVTKRGVDCSGLVQHYFRDVKGVVVPKHSRNQRRLGQVVTQDDVINGDLVFFSSKRKGVPHVGIWWNHGVWSACLKDQMVVWKTLSEMENDYSIEEVRRV